MSGELVPRIEPQGGIIFRRQDGEAVLTYGGLEAWDATGRSLPAKLSVNVLSSTDAQSRIAYMVDDTNASYPVIIDPLFTRPKKLIPTGGKDDHFGYSVSISGDTVAVGAYGDSHNGANSGAAYIFYRDKGDPDNWGQVKKITTSDGEALDHFGYSVSISGDTLVVGAYKDDDKGAAYIFERDEGGSDNWGQVKKVTASDGAVDDAFGYSVSIDGDTVVVGAYEDDDKGSIYIFYRDEDTPDNWGQVKKITASDGASYDSFGYSISISGDTTVVGAAGDDDNGASSGSAYIFYRNQGGTNNWGEVQKITASDGAESDNFGCSVSIDNETLVVGANGDDASGTDSGSAYVYIAIDLCEGGFEPDGDVDGSDLAFFMGIYTSEDPQADLTNDGQVDEDDIAAFAIEFGRTDCPK